MKKSGLLPRHGSGSTVRLSARRPLTLAMVAVVISFVASLWVSQFRLGAIEDRALDIAENATPSSERLSALRVEMRRMGMYASELVAWNAETSPLGRQALVASRARLQTDLEAYAELPISANEQEHTAAIAAELKQLDASLAALVDQVETHDARGARATLEGAIHPAVERIDQSLLGLELMNSAATRQLAAEIEAARQSARALALSLGLVSVAAAVLATVLAIRAIQAQAQLVEERSRLLEARASELEAFAGRVAHDLRQPLGAIALRLVAAQRSSQVPAKVRDDLEKLAVQVRRMDGIIEGLLEFARAGGRPEPNARADVRAVLDEVIADTRPSADEVNAELRLESFQPCWVACTPSALTSIVSNLVRNAIKYVVEGTASVRSIVVRVHEEGSRVRVDVVDTGPGVPSGTEHRIFEPFVRGVTTRQPGVGLGLATVKRLVEAHGGSVGVQSFESHGSRFWFELPKAAPNGEEIALERRAREPSGEDVPPPPFEGPR